MISYKLFFLSQAQVALAIFFMFSGFVLLTSMEKGIKNTIAKVFLRIAEAVLFGLIVLMILR